METTITPISSRGVGYSFKIGMEKNIVAPGTKVGNTAVRPTPSVASARVKKISATTAVKKPWNMPWKIISVSCACGIPDSKNIR